MVHPRFALWMFAFALGMARAEAEVQFQMPAPDAIQMLTLRDGSVMVGRILDIGEEEIAFETSFGRIAILRPDIAAIREVPRTAIKDGAYWLPNPNTTRLFLGSTARTLKQRSAYLSNHYLFFPAITYGFTDHFTLGGGGSLFPGAGFKEQVFYLTPKIGWHASPRLDLAIGALVLKLPSNREIAGILYGVGAYGTPEQSLTLGLGYGFVEGALARRPVAMLGGEKRLTRRMSLVSENWVYPGEAPLISYGLRFFGETLSADFALLNILSEEAVFPGVPYLGFSFHF